jgi:hypothetical protein
VSLVGREDAVGEIVSRSGQLARAFRERGLPIVLVNVSGRPERYRKQIVVETELMVRESTEKVKLKNLNK